jgi:hypothetical protein
MTDEQMQSLLEAWFEDTDPTPPDTTKTAVQVMAHVPQVRQRSRWWPFPVFYRKAQAPTSDIADYQPTSTPATNGHTPTVTGRTQFMFSPAKAITAGALIFAIGGVLLIAQPFDQQGGGVPGAATEVAPPVEFTATWDSNFGPPGVRSDVEEGSDPVRSRGYANHPRVVETTGDPRFEGEVTLVVNHDRYPSNEALWVFNSAFSVANDEGTWRGVPHLEFRFSDADLSGRTHFTSGRTQLFIGEGGYAGSYALADIQGDTAGEGWTLRGVIFEGEPPSAPEPFGAV